eukprot:2089465-Amphidinium_carterae.3
MESSPLPVIASDTRSRLQAAQVELGSGMHVAPRLQVGPQAKVRQGSVLPPRGHASAAAVAECPGVLEAPRRVPRATAGREPTVPATHEDLQTLEAGWEHAMLPANQARSTCNTPVQTDFVVPAIAVHAPTSAYFFCSERASTEVLKQVVALVAPREPSLQAWLRGLSDRSRGKNSSPPLRVLVWVGDASILEKQNPLLRASLFGRVSIRD